MNVLIHISIYHLVSVGSNVILVNKDNKRNKYIKETKQELKETNKETIKKKNKQKEKWAKKYSRLVTGSISSKPGSYTSG